MKSIITIIAILVCSNSLAQSNKLELELCELDSISDMKVLQIVEEPPTYEGGLTNFYQTIAKNIRLPKKPDSVEFKSKFYISFVVDTLGNIKNFCATDIMRDMITPEIMTKIDNWNPGIQKGEKVLVRMKFPIILHYDY